MNFYQKFIYFLRWCERYTKTDMVYLVQGASWLTLTQMCLSLSSFFLIYILANALTSQTLGEYRFLMTGFALLCAFALPGMRTALRESVPKGFTGNLSIAFSSMFRWGLLGTATAFLIAAYYYEAANYGIAWGFLVIGSAVPIYNAATGYGEYLIAIKSLRQNTLYTVAARIITLFATLGAVLFAPQYAWFILAASLLGTIVPNILFHIKTVKLHSTKDLPKDPNLIRYAKHLSVMSALGLLAGQLDKLVIWNVLGAEALALFYIAQTVPQNITANLNTIPTLAFAKFGNKDPQIIRRTLLPKIFKYVFVISIICVFYIICSPFIFKWFFSIYSGAVSYSIALACIPIFGGFLPIKTYLTTIKATTALYAISTVPPSVRIVTALIFIPIYGLWGVVLSMLLEAIVRTFLLIYFFLTIDPRST